MNSESKPEANQSEAKEREKDKKPEPTEDVEFNGEYTDSGDSEDSQCDGEDYDDNDANSQGDSGTNAKNKNQKKSAKKKVQKFKRVKQRLVMNVVQTQYPVIKFVGKKILKWKLSYEQESMEWDLYWTDEAVQPEQLSKMQPFQKINHFPGMFSLARKNHLGRNLMKMKKQFPIQYKFFPQTWLLPAEYIDFKSQFDKTQKGKTKTFIVKPEALSQGKGIFLTRSLEDINPVEHYVVQRYLHKPLLIEGLKFDLRIYVLLAGCDPLRIFVYDEGLARFATEEYESPSKENMDNLCMHLTNYAINKENPNFIFNNDAKKMDVGHKRSLTSLMETLRHMGHDTETLWKKIYNIFILTFISAQPILAHHYRSCQPDNYMNDMCFEVLGMDVILDENLRPYLLEVNHTPSFATETPLDSLIKKNLIRDSINIMNLNLKTKNEIMIQRKEIMQKRVLTGKKVKLTSEEKQELIKQCMEKRDQFEKTHLGGFKKIYPVENNEELANEYAQCLQYAHQQYEESTGANIRRNTKKVLEANKNMDLSMNKKTNRQTDLEKIYKQKSQKIPGSNPNQPPQRKQAAVGKMEPNQQGPVQLSALQNPQFTQQKNLEDMDYEDQYRLQPEDNDILNEQLQFYKNMTSDQTKLSPEQVLLPQQQQLQQQPQMVMGDSSQGSDSKKYIKNQPGNYSMQNQMPPNPFADMQYQQQQYVLTNYNQDKMSAMSQNQYGKFEIQRTKDEEKYQYSKKYAHYLQNNEENQNGTLMKTTGKQILQNNKNEYEMQFQFPEINKNCQPYQQEISFQTTSQNNKKLPPHTNNRQQQQPQMKGADQHGLFITPKLFDLNCLSKRVEEENQKKEASRKNNQSNQPNFIEQQYEKYNAQRQVNYYKIK